MEKRKGKKKINDLKIFEATYSQVVKQNQDLIRENKSLCEKFMQFQNSFIAGHHLKLRMPPDTTEKVWDFSELILLVQSDGVTNLVRTIKRVHHNYAILNIQEMTAALFSELQRFFNDECSKFGLLRTVQKRSHGSILSGDTLRRT